ncbi:MAG TPA: hypothetical protein P5287_00050 [bacterium]|nr:hypothetical protein [bacterium]
MIRPSAAKFVCAIVVGIVSLMVVESAVFAEDLFLVRKITCQKKVRSVTGAFSSGLEGLGNIGGTAHQMWGAVTVVYDSMPAWADDVEVKFYVLTRDKKHKYNLFVGATTYVSVMKGTGHMAHIFIHPNAMSRYGDVKRVMVEIWYKGILVNSAQYPSQTSTRWWTKFKAIDGVLRHRFFTPFLLDYDASEECMKLPTSSL